MPIRRSPHVAGTFYPADPDELRDFCRSQLAVEKSSLQAKAVLLPHAGYIYSGRTACRVLSRVEVPDRILLIGPNHHGVGPDYACMREGSWEMPLGEVPVDGKLADHLAGGCPALCVSDEAHEMEHSLEVELPFLMTRNPGISIVPLLVGSVDLSGARETALCLGKSLQSYEHPVMVVVSSDMSHYESEQVTRSKDAHALQALEQMDAEALAFAVRRYRISMCGFVPAYMLLCMKDLLGLRSATFVEYTTSARASGDTARVVGYAGFIFE